MYLQQALFLLDDLVGIENEEADNSTELRKSTEKLSRKQFVLQVNHFLFFPTQAINVSVLVYLFLPRI